MTGRPKLLGYAPRAARLGLLTACAALVLGGCGQKGPLYLPDKPAGVLMQPADGGAAAPAPAPGTAPPADKSKDKKTDPQTPP